MKNLLLVVLMFISTLAFSQEQGQGMHLISKRTAYVYSDAGAVLSPDDCRYIYNRMVEKGEYMLDTDQHIMSLSDKMFIHCVYETTQFYKIVKSSVESSYDIIVIQIHAKSGLSGSVYVYNVFVYEGNIYIAINQGNNEVKISWVEGVENFLAYSKDIVLELE